MLSFKITENGNLHISVTNKERFDEMIQDAIEKEIREHSYMNIAEKDEEGHVPDPLQRDALMYDVFENLMCNSELRWVDAAEVGALTCSPLIANYYPDEQEDPDPSCPKHLWYYNWYMMRSPVVDLWRDGETFFHSAD